MQKIPFDIVGFDLDGTLVDTSGDLTAAVNHILQMAGRPELTQETVKGLIGGGAKMMLEHGLEISGGVGEGEFRPLYRAMLAYYEENISVYSRPFPGALPLLDRLDAQGIKYGVVTNKFEGLARKLLNDLGLADRMICILGADSLGKENAKPSGMPIQHLITVAGGGRAAYIGDSIYDVMAAKNAGVPSIACSFGFLHAPVGTLGADAIIDHFDDLPEILMRLGERAEG